MTSKRLALQLTPLLDLLLIVIFAQFLEIEQDTTQAANEVQKEIASLNYQVESSEKKIEDLKSVLTLSQKMRFDAEAQNAATQQERDQERQKAADDQKSLETKLADVSDQRDQILKALGEAFETASTELKEQIKQLLTGALSPQPIDPEKVQSLAESLESAEARDLATYLLAYHEIRKRCDIWNLHINEQEIVQLTIGEKEYSIRTQSSEDFQEQLFALYKSLPQSKGLVIIMVSYGEVRAAMRQTVLTSLPSITDRMRADANGLTRFEYAVVGYLPK